MAKKEQSAGAAFVATEYTSQPSARGPGGKLYWMLSSELLNDSFADWLNGVLKNADKQPGDNEAVYVTYDARSGNVRITWAKQPAQAKAGNVAPPPAELDTTIRKWAEYVAKGGKEPVPPPIADAVARLLKPAAPPTPPALSLPPALEAPAKVRRQRKA